MRPLIWFRSDLRVRDNTALFEACRAATRGVLAVFTVCPQQWKEHDWASIKVDFLLRNLRDLSASLGRLGIPLIVIEEPRFGGVPRRLLDVAERHDCDSVWFNLEYEVNEKSRDETVRERFEASGRSVHAFDDQTIVAPHELRTNDGRFYTVFTPYRKKWIAAVEERGSTPGRELPRRQKRADVKSTPISTRVEGFARVSKADLWPTGESSARARLREFLEQRADQYADDRDRPAVGGTSALSPYLALGVISPRECLDVARRANGGELDGAVGVAKWISELIWREFYRHVLVGFPRVCRGEPFDLRTRSISWRDDQEGFERWRSGTTGVPIVDAAMRALRDTGWMHNRLRMITASFLTKNLFVDWRRGERHFMRHLVDGDFANNNGGWQWSASVGTDAAPYFRVFNPVTQSERFDPDGEFIRRHLPELADIEDRAIHLPGERAPALCDACGYPRPIVDLKASRARAIDRFRDGIAG